MPASSRAVLRFRHGMEYRSRDPEAESLRRKYVCECGDRHNGTYGNRRCEDCFVNDQIVVDKWLRVMSAA